MNDIEKMIESLCPEGVEFRTLDELGYFYSGLTGKTKIHFENGNCKYVTYMNIYKNPALNTNITDTVKITEGENQHKIEYGDILFTSSSETADECGMSSVVNEKINEDIYLNSFCFGFRLNRVSDFSPDYLKHLFRSRNLRKQISLTASGVTRFNISKKKFSKIVIPVPPLEIQQKIVKVLDIFTELEATLEAELSLRKKQYEYYRNNLLTFDNVDSHPLKKYLEELCPQGVPCKILPEISVNLDRIRKPISSSKRVKGEYPYYGASGIVDFVEHYIFDGDYLLISEDGANLLARSTPIAFSISGKNWVNNHAHVIEFRNDVTRKFVEYYINSIDISKFISGGAQPKLNQENVNKIEIPFPSLEIQQMIVDILDKFDKLVNDLTKGLPAEINARRQQYEYYRNKLLTFKECKNDFNV
ncbi:restriction endonuclease subunit S [Rodentibacter caecimuris]|uniref:restriction endonuclease subunit S n=1 Tax=Rodentibacter caecimuris TaxID=1796644 RepID=UPI0013A09087|nr:restriction endonuclease subunit S [Rodentibacter heylii]QIA76485.1 restriction endonuclease subunit S [Rodentibacter heylii]